MDLKSRFASGAAKKDWYYSFLKRWQNELIVMKSSSLKNARAKDVRPDIINGWFNNLYHVLKKLNLLNKPQSIYNMDESGFAEEAGSRVVVVKRGTKYANKVQGSGGKAYTTVLLTIPANGIVYNGTKSGWTDDNCFFDYLRKLFIPNTKHLPRPLLLIFDGHYSHLSLQAVRLAIENEIHLLCLPSHSTHLLQPLDVYTLKYVKQQWKQLLWERNKTISKVLDKREFVQLFSKVYDFALIPAHCSTAFAKAGIFPYDPRVIKNDRIIKNTLSTTIAPPEQSIPTLSNELDASPRPNGKPINQQNTLVRSNSAPNLIIDHSPSSTNSQLQPNSTQYDADFVMHDATASVYK
ncbi:unnamed protein product [Rotaria sp. Silwood2]|nr:unnamed protein product [Rotaria sp. Silwood2]